MFFDLGDEKSMSAVSTDFMTLNSALPVIQSTIWMFDRTEIDRSFVLKLPYKYDPEQILASCQS
jgi:hypothetical protein